MIMVKVEFLKDYQCCWKKGQVGDILPYFAQALIEQGVAKQIDAPQRHKMVGSPEKKKGHNVPHYTG